MSDTNWWFLDLALVIVIAGTLTFGIISGISGTGRILLAIPLICFLPGYALVSALFPDEPNDKYQSFDEGKTGLGNPLLVSGGLESIERFVLSIVFSVALVPTITLLASVTPRGVTVEPVLFGIATVTVLCSLIAIVARYRCTPKRRYTPAVRPMIPFFYPTVDALRPVQYASVQRRNRRWTGARGWGCWLCGCQPPQHDGYTEFAIETDAVDGDVETIYESAYDGDGPQELETTITNNEHDERTYTTVVMLEDVSYDDGDERDVTVHEADELDRQTTTIGDGETIQQTLDVTPTMSDSELRLTLLLYDDEPPEDPTAENAYRVIQLPMEGA